MERKPATILVQYWPVQTFELNMLETLGLATALFFVGLFCVRRSALLQRYSIPVPVVGGVLFALLLAIVGLVTHAQLVIDDSPKDPLLLAFFATLGLGADVRSLARGPCSIGPSHSHIDGRNG